MQTNCILDQDVNKLTLHIFTCVNKWTVLILTSEKKLTVFLYTLNVCILYRSLLLCFDTYLIDLA